jgi:thiamine-phosphate pyrophosphorylase
VSELHLTLVSDRRRTPGADVAALARAAARAGVDHVQVREKDLPDRALRALVAAVVEAVAGTRTAVIVNGRPDMALLAGARGVQLPESGLPISEVRRAFPGLWIGASCHSLEAARRAEAEGADAVVLGPIFATPGKEDHVLGLDALAAAACALRVPVHAVGGIDVRTAGRAVASGARGLLAIRAFLEAPVADAVRALRSGAVAMRP